MDLPYSVKESDFKGDAYRLNQLLAVICGKIDPASAASVAASAVSGVLMGSHADRANFAAKDNVGKIFVETDRNALYQSQYVSGSAAWKLIYAKLMGTLSPDQKPAGLGTNDVGFEFESTDFLNIYQWGGAAWKIKSGTLGPGMVMGFDASPGAGWHLCDGTAGVAVSTATGGTTTKTMPVLNTGAFPRGGAAYNGAVTAATVPVAGNNSAVQALTTGVAVTNVAKDPHTHAITLPAPPVAYVDLLYYYKV